ALLHARFTLSLHCSLAPRDLHSFPTRRSSDLLTVAEVDAAFTTIGAVSGKGSVTTRRHLVGELFSRATASEQSFLLRLLSGGGRSEEHTSELQSLTNLVCRLLLEKKKKKPRHR